MERRLKIIKNSCCTAREHFNVYVLVERCAKVIVADYLSLSLGIEATFDVV